jgi:nitroimidazol reductase NimA-like FMN-containing flavoprotein (pyridoxamine 5'-phosphate oxidase superfamily)
MAETKEKKVVRLSVVAPLRGDKRWNYLERARTIRVATTAGDGPIYISPLWFVVKDRTIYLPIDQASKHQANLAKGGRLGATVDQGDELATTHGVIIEGTGKPVEDEALRLELHELVVNKYFYGGHPYLDDYVEIRTYTGNQWLELEVTRMYGFDLRELAVLPINEKRYLP